MTQPVEKRMSPTGPKVGEGARLGRRIGGWKLVALLLSAFPLLAGGLFAPMPWAAVCGVAFVALLGIIAGVADT